MSILPSVQLKVVTLPIRIRHINVNEQVYYILHKIQLRD